MPNNTFMVVITFYRLPCIDKDYLNAFIEEIITLKCNYETSYFYVCDDFNLLDVDWKTAFVSGAKCLSRL